MPARAINLARQLRNQRRPLPELRALQLQKLGVLLHESYEQIPFYRRLMQRAGVTPGSIKTLDDLARLPLVSKDDLRAVPESERLNQARCRSLYTRRMSTSGSSGNPFDFVVDEDCDRWRKAQYLRPYISNGRRPWHRVLRLTAFPTGSGAWYRSFRPFGEFQIGCTGPVEAQLQCLLEQRPAILQGYPSALRCLAFEILSRDLHIPKPGVVFTDSELLTPDTRKMVESAFQAPVIDIFGSYETDNIAYQCSRRSSYHVAVDSVITEIVRDGEIVADGSEGELVVTVLDNLAMPFIRYNLQDIMQHITEPCPCGNSFPMLNIVAGRRDDLVVRDDGRLQSPLSFLGRFDALSAILREYQIVQKGIDKFEVRVVPVRPLSEDDIQQVWGTILTDFPHAGITITSLSHLRRSPAAKLKAFVNEFVTGNGGHRGD
jgi:phenylacetate-coenzyme A ligase PaaK-like adenylate-forming protein